MASHTPMFAFMVQDKEEIKVDHLLTEKQGTNSGYEAIEFSKEDVIIKIKIKRRLNRKAPTINQGFEICSLYYYAVTV